MVIEYSENEFREFNEEMETESTEMLHYDTFLLYARSENSSDRKIAIRDLVKLSRTLNIEKEQRQIEVVFNLIENIFAKETDSKICGMLVEQIPLLYVEFMAIEHLLKRVHKVFPELLASALDHSADDVRKSAIGAIDTLVEQRILPQGSLQNVICPTLFGHCYCPSDYSHYITDDQRVDSLMLLCKIVTWPGALTKRWIFENFLGRYSILLQDTAFHIRKTCVTILGKLAAMFGRNFTEKFAVPFLIASSEDLAWGVRKSSCEVFVEVANYCTMETKEHKLAPHFIILLHDSSRWVTHVAFQQLGRFIATFADENRMSLEIKDGRLVTANYDIMEDDKSMRNNCKSNGIIIEDDENELYSQLPPGVVFPESDTGAELGESSSLLSPEDQDQSYVLNELTCFLESWSSWPMSDEPIASNNMLIFDSMDLDVENGVAASCSTHSDLTKLMFDDNDDSSGEDDDGIDDMEEESCPMDIEDDDIEICFEEPSQMDINDDMDAYCPLIYWSSGSVDIDLKSYRDNAITNHNSNSNSSNNNNNNKDNNNVKKLVAEFIQRRSNLFYNSSEHNENDAKNVICKYSENDNIMEEDSNESVITSNEISKTATAVLLETDPSTDSVEDKENEQTTSSAINIGTQMVIPQALLDSFVHMASQCNNTDSEINQQCAHNFPAVAFTLGRTNWPCIMGTYKQLSTDMERRVRYTLATSIHEIAAIIGEENAGIHLVPIFERFVEDVEDVKIGLLNHLYDFFKLVTPDTRQKLLSVLPNFLHSGADNGRNWRYRYKYVRQCILLCDLFTVHDINEYLAAIALTLANDRISDVRKEATILLAKILGKFVNEEWISDYTNSYRTNMSTTDSFISDIVKGFARSMNWRRRQTFAVFCEKILENEILNYNQFSLLLLNDLMRLAGDSVANVRLAFVRSLSKTRGGYAFHGSCDSSIVRHSLETLLSDRDVDCRRAARISLGIPDTENAVNVKNYAQRLREMKEIISAKYHIN
nr:BMA-PPFR-1, isoform a [Brugia malayi]